MHTFELNKIIFEMQAKQEETIKILTLTRHCKTSLATSMLDTGGDITEPARNPGT